MNSTDAQYIKYKPPFLHSYTDNAANRADRPGPCINLETSLDV
jgi:hypothetical protein